MKSTDVTITQNEFIYDLESVLFNIDKFLDANAKDEDEIFDDDAPS